MTEMPVSIRPLGYGGRACSSARPASSRIDAAPPDSALHRTGPRNLPRPECSLQACGSLVSSSVSSVTETVKLQCAQ
jgi:hypothetical protein